LNFLKDTAHHLSVLLLYAFRQQNSSSYWYSYAASGILHYCGQTAGWTKTPLGTEVDLGAGHIVLDGFPVLREMGTAPPPLRPMPIVATVAHLSYCWALVEQLCSSCSWQDFNWLRASRGFSATAEPLVKRRHHAICCCTCIEYPRRLSLSLFRTQTYI